MNHMIDMDITVGDKELKFLKKDFTKLKVPVNIDYFAERLKDRFSKKVRDIIGAKLIKIYDPANDYTQGDVISKKFGKLRLSKKKEMVFNDYAVGIVYDKIFQGDTDYDLICVNWENEYVSKQDEFYRSINATRYYPVNFGRKPGKAKYLGEGGRVEEKEIVEEEIDRELTKMFRSRLLDVIFDDEELVNWGNLWYHIDFLEEVEYEKINEIAKMLNSSRLPVATEKFVKDIFKVRTENPRFLHHRFSVNFTLETYFKEKFMCMSHFGGGKWDLRSKYPDTFGVKPLRTLCPKIKVKDKKASIILEQQFQNEHIRKILEDRRAEEEREEQDGIWRLILNYNELICGAIETDRVPPEFFPDDIEVVFYDTVNNKKYFAENHFESNFISNLDKYFQESSLVPGAVLYIKRTDIPATFEIFWKQVDDPIPYNRLSYKPQTDEVTVLEEEIEFHGEVDEYTFIETEFIGKLEAIKRNANHFNSSFDLLVEIFKKFPGPIHFLKLISLVNAIIRMPTDAVASALSTYKCFYHIEKDEQPGYFWLNTDLAGSARKRKEASGHLKEVFLEDLRPPVEPLIYFKPKIYLFQIPQGDWATAQQYDCLPLPKKLGNQEIHIQDQIVIMVNNIVEAALSISNVKEAVPPYMASELRLGDYIAVIGCKIVGKGVCEEVAFPFPPDPGVMVEIDRSVYDQIVDFYRKGKTDEEEKESESGDVNREKAEAEAVKNGKKKKAKKG